MDQKQKKVFDALPEQERKVVVDQKAADRKAIIDKIYLIPKVIDQEDGTYLVKYKAPE